MLRIFQIAQDHDADITRMVKRITRASFMGGKLRDGAGFFYRS